ncbi:MAG: hypothetical protein KatS3mg028_0485 [Bacteroidia bacterium]|nr:MAG: hypothetical protein KatS3mg028_0485 [Bacteroidia bacterium]
MNTYTAFINLQVIFLRNKYEKVTLKIIANLSLMH